MGQYFLIVNLDRKEYLHPHKLDCGLKLWEICANRCLNVIGFLLRKSNEGGGGDIQKEYKNAGRWAGSRLVIVGDYDESQLYQKAKNEFVEITDEIKEEWNDFIELKELKIGGGINETNNRKAEKCHTEIGKSDKDRGQ